MAIRFACQQCGKTVKAPDSAAGKRGKCPYCGQKMTVPLADEPAAGAPAQPTEPAPAGPPPAAVPPEPPPAPPPAAEAPQDLGYGLAPEGGENDDLKQQLIEQALGMDDDLDEEPAPPPPQSVSPAAPAAPPPAAPPAPAVPVASAEPVEPLPVAEPSAPVDQPPESAPPLEAMALPLADEPTDAEAGGTQKRFTPEEVAAMSPMDCVTTFLQLMGESRLEDASRFVGKMKKPQRKEIQSFLSDLDPAALTAPALRDVPPPVQKIFLTQMERQLR